MKQLSLIIIFTLHYIILNSQIVGNISVGVNGGVTYSNISEKNDMDGNYDFTSGYSSGLNIEIKLKPELSLETNFKFYQNGYDFNVKDTLKYMFSNSTNSFVGFEQIVNQNYINNSWLINYCFGDKITFSIQAGGYWALFLNSNYNFKSYYYIDSNDLIELEDLSLFEGYHETVSSGEFDKKLFSEFDFGVYGGLKIGYTLNQKYQIFTTSGFYAGLVDISNRHLVEDISHFNKSFNLSFGFSLKL